MIRVMKQTWPRTWIWGSILMVYLILCALDSAMSQGLLSVSKEGSFDPGFMRGSMALIVCCAYGAYRALAAYPPIWSKYFDWFKTTPWQLGMKFPFGPPRMRLGWVDALVPFLFVLGEWNNTGGPDVILPVSMIIAYMVLQLLILMIHGQLRIAYLLAAGFALRLYFHESTFLALGLLGFLYVIVLVGQRRVLAEFPWVNSIEEGRYRSKFENEFRSTSTRDQGRSIALSSRSYFKLLSPEPIESMPLRVGVWLCVLIGWWVFVLGSMSIDDNSGAPLAALIAIMLPFMALGRLAVFTGARRSPLTLWGRIRNRVFWIRGYDHVYVVPIAVTMLSIGFMAFGWRSLVHEPLYLAVGCVVFSLILILGPPSPTEWSLTGRCRMLRIQG